MADEARSVAGDTAANYLLIVLMEKEIQHAERCVNGSFHRNSFELNGKTCFA